MPFALEYRTALSITQIVLPLGAFLLQEDTANGISQFHGFFETHLGYIASSCVDVGTDDSRTTD